VPPPNTRSLDLPESPQFDSGDARHDNFDVDLR
jgi:hypothetical protein